MEQIIQNQLITAAIQLERQLDSEISALESLNTDDIEAIRAQRLKQMKKQAEQRQEWKMMGHGEYAELADEKEFFEVSKKSANIVCHFYRDGAERCKIVDMHLKILAAKHIEARFCKVNVEKCPFLTKRLRIKVIPSIALIKDSKTKDYIVRE
jgi:thioredoxin-like negative regulator of GroEL